MIRQHSSSIAIAIACPTDDGVAGLKGVLVEIGFAVRVIKNDVSRPSLAEKEVLICAFKDPPASRKEHQAFLRLIRSRPTLAVVMPNAAGDCDPLIENCADFVTWPSTPEELQIRIGRLNATAGPAKREATSSATADNPLNRLVGDSPDFINSIKQIHRVAPFDAPVLITGETGTGKEIVARAIHYQSSRRDGPFIPVNCGALPENLIENELFGHESGAYTDANKDCRGLLHQADGGTIFLDEIDALPLNKGQTALLRVLEDQEYRPLGAERAVSVDVRIIVATNSRLTQLVTDGAFRADLYYRLNILRITLPPLRMRGRDIELLSNHFLKCFSAQYGLEKKISREGLDSLLQYPWPGNVRELQNFLHREYLQHDETLLECSALAETLTPSLPPSPGCDSPDHVQNFSKAKNLAVAQFERQYLVRVISESSGNIAKAARLAGKERRALGRLLKKHNIDAASFR